MISSKMEVCLRLSTQRGYDSAHKHSLKAMKARGREQLGKRASIMTIAVAISHYYCLIILMININMACGYMIPGQQWKNNHQLNREAHVCLSSASTTDISSQLLEIQSDPNPNNFMKKLNVIADFERNGIKVQQKYALLAEIKTRYSQLDFAASVECLCLILKMNFSHDDASVCGLIEDIINFLAAESPAQLDNAKSEIHRTSSHSISALLIGLVGTQRRWKDLPTGARDLLQHRIQATVFHDPMSISLLPEVIFSLGKLSADFQVLSPSFKSALMDAINHIDDRAWLGNVESLRRPDIPKLLSGLSQMKPYYFRDISDSAKVSLNELLYHYGSNMTEFDIANSIHALGKMECPWPSLSGKHQKKLLLNVRRVAPMMTAPALSNTIW